MKRLLPGVVAALLAGFFISGLDRAYWVDLSRFIVVGSRFADRAELAAEIYIYPDSSGYDGQFFYRLAVNPFTGRQCGQGICLDWPRYRQQRIIYPLLARLVALGRLENIPAALLVVNVLGWCLVAVLGGLYARQHGLSQWWGLAFCYLGLLLALAFDLSEITEIVFMLGALLSIPRRAALAAALLALAVLARETAIVLALAVLVVAFWQRWRGWYYYLLPVGLTAAWQLWLRVHWHDSTGLGEMLVFPFQAMLKYAMGGADIRLFILLGLGFAALVLLAIKSSRAPIYLKLAWLGWALMLASMGEMVWESPLSFIRVSSDWYISGLCILLATSKNRLFFVRNTPFRF